MNTVRKRPLSVGPIRAFEAVSRHLSFRAAADELHLTQSAVSRQIQALEEELGAVLFLRGTRRVELSSAGVTLLRAVSPALDSLDAAVRQVRQRRGRRVVSVTTFASFATLWLIPRLADFQRDHPQIDIRISANDRMIEPDSGEPGEIDVALRHCPPALAPPDAVRLFGEQLAPVASPWLLERARQDGPPLRVPADLAQHTLLAEDDPRPTAEQLSWAGWFRSQGVPEVQPARWLSFNYTHQQVQAALTGQGVALARLGMVADTLARGELVEVFPQRRVIAPHVYLLVRPPLASMNDDVRHFCDWVERQAAETRHQLDEK